MDLEREGPDTTAGEGGCELLSIAAYTDMTQIYEGRASTASCVLSRRAANAFGQCTVDASFAMEMNLQIEFGQLLLNAGSRRQPGGDANVCGIVSACPCLPDMPCESHEISDWRIPCSGHIEYTLTE